MNAEIYTDSLYMFISVLSLIVIKFTSIYFSIPMLNFVLCIAILCTCSLLFLLKYILEAIFSGNFVFVCKYLFSHVLKGEFKKFFGWRKSVKIQSSTVQIPHVCSSPQVWPRLCPGFRHRQTFSYYLRQDFALFPGCW